MTFDPERIPAGAVLGNGWRLTQQNFSRGGSTEPDLLGLEFARFTPAPDFLSRVAEVSAPTPKEETVNPETLPIPTDHNEPYGQCRLCQYREKRGPWAETKEETPMPVTAPESYPAEKTTAYGVSKTVGETTVLLEADEDGEIHVPKAGYVEAGDPGALLAAVEGANAATDLSTSQQGVYAVVEITTTKEVAPAKKPEVPLPTRPYSIVTADYRGARVTAVLSVDRDGSPWRLSKMVGNSYWSSPSNLSNIEVVVDMGATE